VIDGISTRPFINIITLFSLLLFILGIGLIGPGGISIRNIVIILSLSISALGIISIYVLRLISEIDVFSMKNTVAVIWIIINYAVIFFLIELISTLPYWGILLVKVLFSISSLLFSYYLYKYLDYNWIKYIIKKDSI